MANTCTGRVRLTIVLGTFVLQSLAAELSNMTTIMASPRVLVFQHAPYCPLGTFSEFLAEDGIEPQIVELNKGENIPDLEPFDALIVLGGPMDVWEETEHPWLKPEKARCGCCAPRRTTGARPGAASRSSTR